MCNLVVPWYAPDATEGEVQAGIDRREALLGMAERLPRMDEGTGLMHSAGLTPAGGRP